MTIPGCASLQGTTRYRERFKTDSALNHYRLEQNLWLSSIGLGTYLGEADEATDRRYSEAVTRAVELGANVIDTAANYRFQRSERAIGAALQRLVSADGYGREEILICTKGGYLPFDGAPPADIRSYVEETFVRPGIATFADFAGGSHCMTPRYLQHQIDQSLANLQLSCIDVYYVHNPESQLGEVSLEEFYRRLREAFLLLEENVAAGNIRMYGVATWNGFRVPATAPGYHSLPRMVETAREAGGAGHNFRVTQLPFNLAMPEAFVLPNQELDGSNVSTLEAAEALGVTVMASASIFQGRVASGLPEYVREPLGALATDAQTAIQFVRSTPGITTALVGMSHREHVEENLQLVRVEPTLPEDFAKLFAAESI
jgi:aryl-alcohol dehydrogenase-like predicted oxidoreductase